MRLAGLPPRLAVLDKVADDLGAQVADEGMRGSQNSRGSAPMSQTMTRGSGPIIAMSLWKMRSGSPTRARTFARFLGPVAELDGPDVVRADGGSRIGTLHFAIEAGIAAGTGIDVDAGVLHDRAHRRLRAEVLRVHVLEAANRRSREVVLQVQGSGRPRGPTRSGSCRRGIPRAAHRAAEMSDPAGSSAMMPPSIAAANRLMFIARYSPILQLARGCRGRT